MNALQQVRLVLALAVAAALAGSTAAVIGRDVDPASGALALTGADGAGHVVWGLCAVLAQILAQSWIAFFGLGSVGLLRRRGGGRRARQSAFTVVVGPILLVAFYVAVIASGIDSYAAARSSPMHVVGGWAVVVITLLVLWWEWRALERLERLIAAADDSAAPATQ